MNGGGGESSSEAVLVRSIRGILQTMSEKINFSACVFGMCPPGLECRNSMCEKAMGGNGGNGGFGGISFSSRFKTKRTSFK